MSSKNKRRQSSNSNQSLRIKIKPETLVTAMRHYFAAHLPGAQTEQLPDSTIYLSKRRYGLNSPITLQAEDLWISLGKEITLDHPGQTVVIHVPDAGEIEEWYARFFRRLSPAKLELIYFLNRLVDADANDATFSALVRHLLTDASAPNPGANTLNQYIELFERCSAQEQSEGIRIMRQFVAERLVLCAFAKALGDYRQQVLDQASIDNPEDPTPWWFNITFAVLKFFFLRRSRRGIELSIRKWQWEINTYLTFFQIYYWEDEALPDQDHPIWRFLPPDVLLRRRPRRQQPPDGELEANAEQQGEAQAVPDEMPEANGIPDNAPQEELELGEEEVARDDPRVDPARYDFYIAQGCKRVVEPKQWFGRRDYVAFLLTTKSGRRIVIVDCATPGNAAYLFEIGRHGDSPEQQQRWTADAQLSKHRLRTQGAPTFIRRFIHRHGWQEAAKNWLNSN